MAQHLSSRWLRLLRHLLEFSARTGARVTALSGEIHVGALAVAEREGTTIHQFISSGIVHPPPRAPIVAFLDWMSSGPAEEIERGLELKLLEIPGHGKRLLGDRNWLSLEISAGGDSLSAAWHSATSVFRLRAG